MQQVQQGGLQINPIIHNIQKGFAANRPLIMPN